MSQMSAMIAKKKDTHVLKEAVGSHKHELKNATMRAGDTSKKQVMMEAYAPRATSTAVDQALGEMFFWVEHIPKQGQLPSV